MNKERIFGLDVMRALAITMVLCSHILYIFPEYKNSLTGLLQLAGVQGVEVFFVLSGYLIGNILYKTLVTKEFTLKTIKQFWIRRWFRTLPLYFLILVINLLVFYSINNKLPQKFLEYFIFLQNLKGEHLLFFPESWSLSVEEFSYLLAPIVVFIVSKITKSKSKSFLISCISLIVLFFISKYCYYHNQQEVSQDLVVWNAKLKPIVIYRLDTIFYGFLMVYLYHNYKGVFQKKYKTLAFIGIGTLVLLHLIVGISSADMNSYQFFWNVLYLPLNSIGIALLIPYLYQLSKPSVAIKSMIEKISKYSYAIYLIHYSLVLYLFNYFVPFSGMSLLQKFAYTVIYLIITYVLSAWLYRFFEKPMMDLRDKPIFKNKKISNS